MNHQDRSLQFLRIVAMAAVGYYLFQVQKKQGSLAGVLPNPNAKLMINTDRVVDTVMPWLNLSPEQRMMVSSMAKETLKGYFEEKGIPSSSKG